MKILILNDTRVENHHGCSRVMNCIDKNLKLRGSFDLNFMPLLHKWSHYEASKKLVLETDLIIINGEGTLHDNAAHIDMLLDIIIFAKVYSVPTVVINSTIINLSRENLRKLSQSHFIFVRDKASATYLKNNNIYSNYCPDLTFWKTKDIIQQVRRKKIGITEGFNFKPNFKIIKSRNLELFSVFNIKQAIDSYSSIRRLIYKSKLFNVFKKKITSVNNHVNFFLYLNEFKFIITGRYHMVCFCLYLKIPFKYVESNTPKISYLLEDIGLNKEKFKFNNTQIIQFSSSENILLDRFRNKSTNLIDSMFDKILNFKNYE